MKPISSIDIPLLARWPIFFCWKISGGNTPTDGGGETCKSCVTLRFGHDKPGARTAVVVEGIEFVAMRRFKAFGIEGLDGPGRRVRAVKRGKNQSGGLEVYIRRQRRREDTGRVVCVRVNCIKRRSAAASGFAVRAVDFFPVVFVVVWSASRRGERQMRCGCARVDGGGGEVKGGGECPLVNTCHQSCFIGTVRDVPMRPPRFLRTRVPREATTTADATAASVADKCLVHRRRRGVLYVQQFFSWITSPSNPFAPPPLLGGGARLFLLRLLHRTPHRPRVINTYMYIVYTCVLRMCVAHVPMTAGNPKWSVEKRLCSQTLLIKLSPYISRRHCLAACLPAGPAIDR